MRLITVAALAALALAACGNERQESEFQASPGSVVVLPRKPEVRRLGRINLQESDSLYLARPAALAVRTRDDHLFVSDAFWGRVLRFSPEGRLLQVYGRRGEGPGELSDPGALAVGADDLLVTDVALSRVTRYALDTGEGLPLFAYRGMATSLTAVPSAIWIGVQNLADSTAVARIDLSSGELRYMGRLPEEFLTSPPLAGIYTGVQVLSWADTVLAGFMGLNRLQLLREDGVVLRDIRVPARERRGELANIVSAMQKMDFPEQFAANSALFRLHRLASGNFALAYYDQSIEGDAIEAKLYLTLLSSDLARACVDREIPVASDAQPYTAFAGSDLFVIQQEVQGERAHTFVDRFRIDEGACFRDAS